MDPVDLEFEGVNTDPWNNTKAAFSAEAEINRKDWGLEYNAVLETGGVVIALELTLGAVVAGPFEVAESELTTKIERVLGAQHASATVH